MNASTKQIHIRDRVGLRKECSMRYLAEQDLQKHGIKLNSVYINIYICMYPYKIV